MEFNKIDVQMQGKMQVMRVMIGQPNYEKNGVCPGETNAVWVVEFMICLHQV